MLKQKTQNFRNKPQKQKRKSSIFEKKFLSLLERTAEEIESLEKRMRIVQAKNIYPLDVTFIQTVV
jgi:hypothetical protein